VFSSIDHYGRYAYGNQPSIGLWNLARLAETLLPLLDPDREQAVVLAQQEIARGADLFRASYLEAMRRKLGLSNAEPEDGELIEQLLVMMHSTASDFTNTFRALTNGLLDGLALGQAPGFSQWRQRWQERQERQPEDLRPVTVMRAANPAVIPRNHRVEEALEAASTGDLGVMERLLRALADPYSDNPENAGYTEPSGKHCRTFCGT
jgi:uncharacterized protein YdiU (UPF0061 family)